MKKIKTILLSLLWLCFCTLLYAQTQDTITYRYDAAGNRISRTIVLSAKSAAVQPVEEQTEVYTEVFADIQLKIYPNPTDGLVKVEISNLPEGQTAQIWLYAMSGQLITTYKDISDAVTININDQPAGVYVMRIVAGTFRTEWKIIKK